MKSYHCLLPHVYVKPYLRHYVMKSCHISFFIQDSTLLHAFKTASLTHKVNYATLKLYYCLVNNNNSCTLFSVSIILCTLGQNILETLNHHLQLSILGNSGGSWYNESTCTLKYIIDKLLVWEGLGSSDLFSVWSANEHIYDTQSIVHIVQYLGAI